MGDSQIIVENGRVSSLFKTLNGIAITLISALLIWMAASLQNLNTQVAVLISQNASKESEHTRINERLSKLEDRVNGQDK